MPRNFSPGSKDVRCNGVYDCADYFDNPNDKSDEENCGCYNPYDDLEPMPMFECKLSNSCIQMPLRCDGKVDCDVPWGHEIYNGTDKSDEENCKCFKDSDCNEYYPKCLFGKCRVIDEDPWRGNQPSYGKLTPSSKGKLI